MMPQVVSIHVRRGQRKRVRLWIPVLPVLVVLAPLVVLALLISLPVLRVNPVRGTRAMWRLLCAARGLRLEVQDRKNTVHVRFQ